MQVFKQNTQSCIRSNNYNLKKSKPNATTIFASAWFQSQNMKCNLNEKHISIKIYKKKQILH